MPEVVFHYYFADRVLRELPEEIGSHIRQELYQTGARGPDPFGLIRFWWPPAWRREHGKSSVMHNTRSGQFFSALAKETRNAGQELKDELFSYLCGFLTHYRLDASCHPYIIDQTGLGPGTAGNHRSLEHALDRDLLRKYGLQLRDRPITRKLLPAGPLPENMADPLNRVYRETFGWENAWSNIRKALKDERRFLRLTEDPLGALAKLLPRSCGGTIRSLSYAEKAYEDADIWNRERRTWHHPYDPGLESGSSLEELAEEALRKATAGIIGLYGYIYQSNEYPDIIGSDSYESGFDTEDARNQMKAVCHPLRREAGQAVRE